jgi:hypothetical protein
VHVCFRAHPSTGCTSLAVAAALPHAYLVAIRPQTYPCTIICDRCAISRAETTIDRASLNDIEVYPDLMASDHNFRQSSSCASNCAGLRVSCSMSCTFGISLLCYGACVLLEGPEQPTKIVGARKGATGSHPSPNARDLKGTVTGRNSYNVQLQ